MKWYVGKKEVALKLRDDGRLVGLIPDFVEEDTVPGYVQFLMAIMVLIRTRDKAFQNYVNRRWKEIMKKGEDE